MPSFRSFLLVASIVPVCCSAQGQRERATYRLRPWVDAPVIMGTGLISYGGMVTKREQQPLERAQLTGLNTSGVLGFDRAALRIDLSDREEALQRSDMVLGISVAAPLLLGLDPRVREQWKPIAALYAEAMLVNTAVQSWTACTAGRYRPITYRSDATIDQRTDPRNVHSFFSGHTSSTATASFFMAKVLDDLHPELGGKRWLLYGAAAIPPALAGYYRIQAGKHFPTDVLTGFLFGAATGVLVPEWHKRPHRYQFSLMPAASDEAYGLALSWTW
jgi:hypothetical protein